MLLIDEIRKFVNEKYFVPARSENKSDITIRAGTVHDQMRLENKQPSVCNALRSKKLQDQYKVQLTNVKYGPNVNQENAKNIWYTFQLL